MNILVLSNLYPPLARGGAEQIARRGAIELSLCGHQVTVLSTRRNEGPSSWSARMTQREPEAIYRFFPPNLYHLLDDHRHAFPTRAAWHLIDLWSPHSAREVGRLITRVRPDVVVTHNLKGLGLQAVRAIRASGIPHVHVLHDVQLSVPSGLLLYGQEDAFPNGSWPRRWYERWTQAALGSPEIILAPSCFLLDFHRSRGFFQKSRFELLPNPAPKLPAATHRTAASGGPLRLLCAGQLEEHKGIRFLYDALRGSDLAFELHIAGDGTLANEVSAWTKVDPRIIYHGFVSLDNLTRLFHTSDATVVPSLCYEGSPTIIYESLQAGVPVVASKIGGVGELIADGKNGYLFAPGDRASLGAALEHLTERKDASVWDASNVRASVEAYGIDHYIRRFEDILKSVLLPHIHSNT